MPSLHRAQSDLLRENGALDEVAALELELKKSRQRAANPKK
jgi:hypothetical protein